MIPVILLLAIGVLIIFYPAIIKHRKARAERESPEDKKTEVIANKLMMVATQAIKERKTYRAEKALLTLLKVDERNATAYNRLGILYAKQKKNRESIECFEIANGIDPNASSLHNAGLIYFEEGRYEDAALMFSRSIELEGDASVHYAALAKTEIKLGNRLKAVEALEDAFNLAPSIALLKGIQQIYTAIEDEEAVKAVDKRIEALEQKLTADAVQSRTKHVIRKPSAKKATPRRSPSIKSATRKITKRKKVQ